MKIISVNVGLPKLIMRDDEPVSTGIFKEPVAGFVTLRTLNLDGDRQADLTVHGGPEKAVYAIRTSTTRFGNESCRTWISVWESSVRTSRHALND